MKTFDYTAQFVGGGAISGTVESSDSAKAMDDLQAMGLLNIELREGNRLPVRRPIGGDDFIFFNEQLASLASSGTCLDEGLRRLAKDIESPRMARALNAMASDIERGQSLPDALERHAPQLPAFYSRVVRAGVQAGQLPATLLNLSQHLRLVVGTRRLLVEALAYPTIVMVLAFAVLCAVLLIIAPQFVISYRDFGIRLPLITRFMIALADALPSIILGLGAIILIIAVPLFAMRYSARGRLFRERLVLCIPFVGPMLRNSLRARFLRSLAFAVETGVPLPEGIRLSADATGSPVLAGEGEAVAAHFEQSGNIEEASGGTQLIPAMFAYLVRVESNGGDLRNGLMQLSKAYESRALQSQALLRGMAGPIAILGVGIVIGCAVAGLFLPLVSMFQAVSG